MTTRIDRRWRRPLTASLPMYDLPELQNANDAFWLAIGSRLRARGVRAPPELTRGDAPLEATWLDPRLILSQTCGYPLMTSLGERVALVGTPSYHAPGCDGPYHRSAVIVRAGSPADTLADLKGRRCAVNQPTSNTGMNLLRADVSIVSEGPSFFGEIVHTGAHHASVQAVADGTADVAAIDAVTFALLQRLRPTLTRAVRLLHWTVRTPGLPLITSWRHSDRTRAALAEVLAEVAADPTLREVRNELMLDGFTALPRAHYRSILHLAHIAADGGYPELR
jgi:ABC-type phosphate/phosphonate transport system substrate-binding protein